MRLSTTPRCSASRSNPLRAGSAEGAAFAVGESSMLGPLRYPAPGAAHALGHPGSIPAIQARRVDGFKADISYPFQNTSLTCRSRVLQTDAPDIEPRMFTPFHLQMAALNVFFS